MKGKEKHEYNLKQILKGRRRFQNKEKKKILRNKF